MEAAFITAHPCEHVYVCGEGRERACMYRVIWNPPSPSVPPGPCFLMRKSWRIFVDRSLRSLVLVPPRPLWVLCEVTALATGVEWRSVRKVVMAMLV